MHDLYHLSGDNTRITFTLDEALFYMQHTGYTVKDDTAIFLGGPFNKWLPEPDPAWKLPPEKPEKKWMLRIKTDLIRTPGNSGYPEFNFIFFDDDGIRRNLVSKEESDFACSFLENYAVLFPEDDRLFFEEKKRKAEYIKTLRDFNLKNAQDRMVISNFRKVLGAEGLFRSYHPYKKSFRQFETEDSRSAIVKELMEETGIASVVCLSGEEKALEANGETISVYHKQLIDKGNVYFTDTSYEDAYFDSAGKRFSAVFADIVRFIGTHEAPVLVHCRLGSDRTGVVCALLAALCGVPWREIAEDYKKTSDTGIGQFRDSPLLRYSLEKILGKTLTETGDHSQDFAGFYITGGYLTQKNIALLRTKLCQTE
ncbi:tyrosine-protein phosphatase [Brucepastera parasyntrophica]|uniref:tyrosine-protein phosphatase n=1 Tax=Brucepastera parasyntrophica TaxID=2880008 RepID=UPI00210B1974|nr:tyrosine-protein phosphatase [Brucepastera parasyntrophica]ULQ58961.1 tyrosine-protein phosphatase [Brucepastera parasyntrophica]